MRESTNITPFFGVEGVVGITCRHKNIQTHIHASLSLYMCIYTHTRAYIVVTYMHACIHCTYISAGPFGATRLRGPMDIASLQDELQS